MNQQLLNTFFEGKCDPEELREVLSWYSNGEAGIVLEKEITDVLESKYPKNFQKTWNKDLVFSSIKQKIEATTEEEISFTPSSKPIYSKRRNVFKAVGIAASLFITLGIGWWLGTNSEISEQEEVVADKIEYVEREAPKGQKLALVLPDGTQIKLNSDSRIWFRKDIARAEIREVHLEGEAFFNVAKDSLHPFHIYTDGIETKVLGTSFNISAYSENRTVAVAVVTGKVAVKNMSSLKEEQVQLVPGEKALYSRDNIGEIEKMGFDYKEEIAWKDGVLHFSKADFNEVKTKLERWYGKKFIVENRTIEKKLTGTYTDKSLRDVLDGMSYVLHFTYEIKDEIVVIK